MTSGPSGRRTSVLYQGDPVIGSLMALAGRAGPWAPLAAAVVFWLMGFGALALMYGLTVRYGWSGSELTGLYDFWAVRLGDAASLPVAVGLSVALYLRLEDVINTRSAGQQASTNGRGLEATIVSWAPPILAGILIAGMYSQWLGDSSADRLNWTQPAPGVLNGPGIYHLAFMAVSLWWFLAFIGRMWWAWRLLRVSKGQGVAEESKLQLFQWAVVNGILGCLVVFGVGLALDAAGRQLSFAGQPWDFSQWAPIVMGATAWFVYNTVMAASVLPRVLAGAADTEHEAVYAVFMRFIAWVSGVVLLVAVAAFAGILLNPPPSESLLAAAVAGIALPVLLMLELKSNIYDQQLRSPQAAGSLWILSMCLLFSAAALWTVSVTASVALGAHSFASALRGCWSAVVLVPATAVTCWTAIVVGKVECLRADECGAKGYRTDQEPWHGVVQNSPQYAALTAFLLLPVLAYRLGVNRLLLADLASPPADVVVALLYGFLTLAAAVVVFPLTNNMEYIREVDARKADFAHTTLLSGDEYACSGQGGDRSAKALVSHITLVSLSIGGIAVLLVGWLLVGVATWVFS